MLKTLLLVSAVVWAGAAQADDKPNIIFILADDFGWADWNHNGGEHGSTFYETPSLNQMASEGVYFSQAYALPLCSPSRGTLMSGQYVDARLGLFKAITGGSVANPAVPKSANPRKEQLWPTSRDSLPLETVTIAEMLKENGYKTFHFGKWHLGNRNKYPVKQGFDRQRAVKGAGPGVPNGYFAPFQVDDFIEGEEGDYLADKITDEVLETIEENRDQPFFLYLAHFNVHSPYYGKPAYVKKYAEKAATLSSGQRHPVMGAMVQSLDESAGRILDKLDELNLSSSTLVVFMGDNGGVHFKNSKDDYSDIPITVNGPLREGKGTFYEGGVRVPLIVRMPGKVPAHVVEVTPVHLVDFYPTLASFAGIELDQDDLDGVDIRGLLTQEEDIEERALFCHFPRERQVSGDQAAGGSFIRKGDYKLLRYYLASPTNEDVYELYNLRSDIGETHNLLESEPQVAASLKAELAAWLRSTCALTPQMNPNYSAK
ncbi:sulfatase [Thalassoglobus sp. JC818]|uniref:sulfatase n=1 Tax=Thalassoglobus sp. JC818 TaxID=3232136 RepID=UPI003458C0EC